MTVAEKPNIIWKGSPNFGYPNGTHGRQGYKHKAIVYHIMEGSLTGTDSWFASRKSGASTHFGVGRNGEIHQYVDLDDAPYGNGAIRNPSWTGLIPDGKGDYINPNLYTISIEHEGKHERDERHNIITFWEPTEAQYQATLALTRWLIAKEDIAPSLESLIGHNQIDSVSRANCPGPGFPFKRLFADLVPRIPPLRVTHNGEVVECEPTNVDGSTRAKLRPLVEALKGRVVVELKWDGASQTANIVSRPERWWSRFIR